jgi:HEAT repeat protein
MALVYLDRSSVTMKHPSQRVLPYLDHEEQRVRSGAIGALRIITTYYPDAIDYLRDALTHEHADVRRSAMRATAYHGARQERASEFRDDVELMRHDPSELVREEWLDAMEHIVSPQERELLIRELIDGPDAALRLGAFWQLHYRQYETDEWSLKFDDLVPTIAEAMSDDDLTVRRIAIDLLFSIPVRDRTQYLELFQQLALDESEDAEVRNAAIRHLRTIGRIVD